MTHIERFGADWIAKVVSARAERLSLLSSLVKGLSKRVCYFSADAKAGELALIMISPLGIEGRRDAISGRFSVIQFLKTVAMSNPK